ncbi:MAG TPA: D-mannonate dehydratase [Candidatus Handelsmanbacteria bacterium]|nr:D-mannonate dehydratase [Candidatus Handelsmanbacteria bacterium]
MTTAPATMSKPSGAPEPHSLWNTDSPRLHLGTQRFMTTDDDLEFLNRHGVENMALNRMPLDREFGWDVDWLGAQKEKAAGYGVDLQMVALPIQQMNADGGSTPNYMLGDFDRGEEEVELVCKMVRAAGAAGIPSIKYFLCEMENQRTESVPPGRGNTRYSTFDLSQADADSPRYDQPVTAAQNWERVTFFLERVIPVAEEAQVRMACHPCDPWLPPGFKGVDRILGGADGFKQFVDICPSPYHGLNLCLGCMAESVEDPVQEVPKILRYFGERKKIHLIHFRNIFGGRCKFQEVWPDEGVMDMYVLMKTLHEVGYPHMVVPDHAPASDAPGSREQSFAFQFGYIRAMLQAVESVRGGA